MLDFENFHFLFPVEISFTNFLSGEVIEKVQQV